MAAATVVLIVVLIVALSQCSDDGATKRSGLGKGSQSESERADEQALLSLLEYAKKLEAAGNYEAASIIYERILQGGGADLIRKAHEEIPVVRAADEIEQIEEIFGQKNGGDGE